MLPGQRIPELDNRIQSWTGTWLGNDKVIMGVPDPGIIWGPPYCMNPVVLDLHTHTYLRLPKLKDEPDVFRSNPYPSPDGKWLLYTEESQHKEKVFFRRLRLVHPDGSGTRLIPFPPHDHVLAPCWLANSSGWVCLADDGSKRVAYRFNLATLSGGPTRLVPLLRGRLATISNQSELIFDVNNGFHHYAVPLSSTTAQPRELDIRHGDLEAFWPGYHGGPWPLQFSRDGSFLLVRGYSRSLGDQSDGLWRIPIPGGALERLPVPSDVVDFSLSPNGKKVLYWRRSESGTQAYLLTLTGT